MADDSKELCALCLLGFCIVLRFLHEKSDVALSVADELAWRYVAANKHDATRMSACFFWRAFFCAVCLVCWLLCVRGERRGGGELCSGGWWGSGVVLEGN